MTTYNLSRLPERMEVTVRGNTAYLVLPGLVLEYSAELLQDTHMNYTDLLVERNCYPNFKLFLNRPPEEDEQPATWDDDYSDRIIEIHKRKEYEYGACGRPKVAANEEFWNAFEPWINGEISLRKASTMANVTEKTFIRMVRDNAWQQKPVAKNGKYVRVPKGDIP